LISRLSNYYDKYVLEALKDVLTGEDTLNNTLVEKLSKALESDSYELSPEFIALKEIAGKLQSIRSDKGITIIKGETESNFDQFEDLLSFLMAKAKKGTNMQRYKGLGEMNPDQLWETTMDPEVRRLLKVVIEDNVSSDDTFTILMGDQVEPRREFIEDNAFSVSNLDV